MRHIMRRPLIGITLYERKLRRLTKRYPSPLALRAHTAANLEQVTLVYFSLNNADVTGETLRGWYIDTNGEWNYSEFPWPDVIYLQRTTAGKSLHNLRSKAGLINYRSVLRKAQCDEALRSHSDTAALLPETCRLTSKSDLASLLHRHSSVIVKRNRGLGGEHMAKVYQSRNSTYCWEHSAGQRVDGLKLTELFKHIQEQTSGGLIGQQEINVFVSRRRRHLIGTAAYKNGIGRWRTALPYVFIGRPDHFLVNRHTGAILKPFTEGLYDLGLTQRTVRSIHEQTEALTIRIAQVLDEAFGPLGELGMDWVFDNRHKLYLLEVNLRVNKGILPFAETESLLLPYRYLWQYARYLYLTSR